MARETPAPVILTVLRTESLSAHLVRVVLGGEGFDTLAPRVETDSYVRVELAAGEDTAVRTTPCAGSTTTRARSGSTSGSTARMA